MSGIHNYMKINSLHVMCLRPVDEMPPKMEGFMKIGWIRFAGEGVARLQSFAYGKFTSRSKDTT